MIKALHVPSRGEKFNDTRNYRGTKDRRVDKFPEYHFRGIFNKISGRSIYLLLQPGLIHEVSRTHGKRVCVPFPAR